MTAGPLITALGLGLLTTLNPDSRIWLELIPMIAVFGAGMGITVAPLTNAVMTAAAEKRAGIAAAFNNMVSRVAGLIAVALIGVVVSGTFTQAVQVRIRESDLSSPMESRLREISENPTGSGRLDELSPQAQRAYQESFTAAFRSAMILTAGLAASGSVFSLALIRNQGEETSR